jgi:hypothetical protein
VVAPSKPPKSAAVTATGKGPKKPVKTPVKAEKAILRQPEWLQDVSIEAPVPGTLEFEPGQRHLDFSVGMRQLRDQGHIRSELRARATVHAENVVLLVIEASYVNIAPEGETRADLPEYLYLQLKPQLEKLLAVTGHNPPLPASLDKIS